MNTATVYLRVEVEKRLSGPAWASIDEAGNLLVIQDASRDESEQVYTFLDAQATRALRNLLNSPEASNLIRQP